VHAAIAGLPLEVRLFQGFSLMGQPRDAAPSLARVLKDVGLETGDEVGVIGWKYLIAAETFYDPRLPAWAPTILTDALDRITGVAPVDVTAVLMNPGCAQATVPTRSPRSPGRHCGRVKRCFGWYRRRGRG
jgi:hypothetical protein